MRFGRSIVFAGSSACVLLVGWALATSSPASAGAGTVARPSRIAAPRLDAASVGGTTTVYNSGFAGYEAFQTGNSSVSTTFKIPRLTCNSTTSGIGPGAFMVAGSGGFDAAEVSLECPGGTDLTEITGEYLIVDGTATLYNSATGDTVATGDTIDATVSVNSSATTVTLQDTTPARAFTITETGAADTSAAEFVGNDSLGNSPQLPLAAFNPTAFSNTTVGGGSLASATPDLLDVASGCAVLESATGIRSGTGFTVLEPAIQISGLTPSTGPTGTSVTIDGSGFNSSSTVKFSGKAATAVGFVSSTELTATVPSTAVTGAVSITNTAAPLGSGSSACNFEVTPTITGFSPTSGATGATVTINGTGFSQVRKVEFGTHAAAAKTVSSSQITATVPNGIGPSTITVENLAGSATTTAKFTPTLSITALLPASGPIGTLLKVNGVGFNASSTVKVNGVAATSVKLNSPTQLQAKVAAGTTTGLVTVANTSAPTGTVTSAAKFTITPSSPPTITSFTPTSGITGSSVTINGTFFSGATLVKFGTIATAFRIISADQITATVAYGAVTSPISVTTPVSTVTSTAKFTPTLSITSFTPASGAAGTVVTINGVGFNSSSTVKFNGVAASQVTHVSSTQLTATVPSGSTAGPITVTNTSAPVGTVRSARTFS